jgi:hypothetical protein
MLGSYYDWSFDSYRARSSNKPLLKLEARMVEESSFYTLLEKTTNSSKIVGTDLLFQDVALKENKSAVLPTHGLVD